MASAREGGECSRGSKYDVFLSFRGPDTRNGFVDCLYVAMTGAGIRAFHDNERLHVGEMIGDELMRAIDDSKICMPIFSRNYASSKWCLLELECIMKGRPGQDVIPVFYDVSPDDVKLRTSLYSDGLKVLEEKHGPDEVDRWRKCLKEVCEIKGYNLEESPRQGKLIERIVKQVLYKTKKKSKNVTEYLVGIEDRVEAIMKLLHDQIDRVRFVIIHGMGGIGKTTLAKVIFNEVSSNFQGCCFLSNVRESSQGNGIVKLQQQILNDVLGMSESISDEDDGIKAIRERCSNKRVLLVLDDVNDIDQICKLAGKYDWFKRGSRIIITTRDISVIPIERLSYDAQRKNKKQKIEGEDDRGDICYYEMLEMDHQHATTLFNRLAFGVDENSFDYKDLLDGIVASTGSLPLALEVVGSYLFGKNEKIWRETLEKLRKAPDEKVQEALKISYDALKDTEKQIFLDIACLFKGENRCILMYVWEASGLYPESGVNALLQKSLIKIDDRDIIWMHDQLTELGRGIDRTDEKSSRVWIDEEAFRTILNKKGTRDVILLELGGLLRDYKFDKAAFKELVNLRVLRLDGGNLVGDFSNYFPQLMWLDWSFHSNFQAKNFSPPNLVVLKISQNDIDGTWTGWKGLLGSKLKFLELSWCDGLTRTPDFSTCLGLEVLVLTKNKRLTEIDSSIGKLEQLIHLEIKGSPNLRGLPQSLALLKTMEKLIIIGDEFGVLHEKFHLPLEFEKLKSLCHLAIENVGLESLPKGIGQLKLLKYLSFEGCTHLTSLPESVWELESLVELNLKSTRVEGFSGKIERLKELKVLNLSSTRIRMLPEGIRALVKLEELNLSNTGIVELPSSVIQLSCLQYLYLDNCTKLRKVEHLPTSLSRLELPYFSLQVVPDISNLVNIVELKLFFMNCLSITDDEEDRSTRFRSLDGAWIERFPKLKSLVIDAPSDVFHCLEVDLRSILSVRFLLSCYDDESLSQLPHSLSELVLNKFWATTLDLSLFRNLSNLFIDHLLSDEIELRGLEVLENLKMIDVKDCESLVRLSISSCPKKLMMLRIADCSKLVEVGGVSRLESLQMLEIFMCPSLSRLPDLSNLVKLNHLSIMCCGKLRTFYGRHDRYDVDRIEGPVRCVILRRWIKCISDLFLSCFCFP